MLLLGNLRLPEILSLSNLRCDLHPLVLYLCKVSYMAIQDFCSDIQKFRASEKKKAFSRGIASSITYFNDGWKAATRFMIDRLDYGLDLP